MGKIVSVAHDSAGAAGINFAIDYPESTASVIILNCGFSDAVPVHWPELIELFATKILKALTTSLLQNPGQLGWVVNPQRELFKNSLPDKYKERYHAALVAGVGRGELNTYRQTASAWRQLGSAITSFGRTEPSNFTSRRGHCITEG